MQFTSLLYQSKNTSGWQFGFRLPFLPDFLNDHTLLNKEWEQRLVEVCSRWTQLVAGLWRESGDVTYSLRFDWIPEKEHKICNRGLHPSWMRPGAVTVMLLGRVHPEIPNQDWTESSDDRLKEEAENVARDVARALDSLNIEHIWLNDADFDLLALPEGGACYELCQHEYFVPV